jgi:hypothetical protein
MSTGEYIPIPLPDNQGHDAVSVLGPLLPFSLHRRLFLESSTFALGIHAICTVPRHVSNNLIVAGASVFGLCLERERLRR